jgi:hypothetical protein
MGNQQNRRTQLTEIQLELTYLGDLPTHLMPVLRSNFKCVSNKGAEMAYNNTAKYVGFVKG